MTHTSLGCQLRGPVHEAPVGRLVTPGPMVMGYLPASPVYAFFSHGKEHA